MTSANVTEYNIFKGEEIVGHHREHAMCKSHFEELLKFEPLHEYEIMAYGYDEEEELWEGELKNLETFLRSLIRFDKTIREYFNGKDDKKGL